MYNISYEDLRTWNFYNHCGTLFCSEANNVLPVGSKLF